MKTSNKKRFLSLFLCAVLIAATALLTSGCDGKRPEAAEISTRNDADRVLTLIKADDYTYTFSSGGEPLSVSGVFNGQEFKMDIDRFEITQK